MKKWLLIWTAILFLPALAAAHHAERDEGKESFRLIVTCSTLF